MSSQPLQSTKIKITLEEVLRLKRREKPSAEFWEQFDRELRRKTLRALVDEKPWHQKYLTPVFGRLAIALPLAAATVLALVFTIFQDGISLGDPTLGKAQTSLVPKGKEHRAQSQGYGRGRNAFAHTQVNNASRVAMPFTSSYVTVQTRVSFVINVIPLPSNSQRAFDTVMTPHTLTASNAAMNLIQKEPMAGDTPLVKFVSAPTLDYF